MPSSYVMNVSSNGQVSIPAAARSRWNAQRLLVVDLGDRVVMRPLPEDRIGALVGKHRKAASTDDAHRRERAENAATERRKRR